MTQRVEGIRRKRPARLGVLAALALCAALLAPAASEARIATLDGQLLTPPKAKGGKVQAPVLLSETSLRRFDLETAVATLVVRRSAKLSAPSPNGGKRIEIDAEDMRSGDTVRGRAKVPSGEDPLPKLKVRKLRVRKRESGYSVDELADAILKLATDLDALSARVDELSDQLTDLDGTVDQLNETLTSLQSQVSSLQSQLSTLQGQLNSLNTTVGSLQTTVNSLDSQLDTLQGTVDGICALVVITSC